MKVAVIIPSYNEANNISFVTKKIDRGLILAAKKFSKITEVIIVNVDNSSKDNTSKIFQKTKTNFPKISLQTKGRSGKGKNIIYFLKNNYQKYDIFITLDADLKSIKADWIIKLIAPFFNERKKCDFIWPLYKRSRFEGSTTNHFAYPIIYGFFKLDVRQPIAGDFAFSQRLATRIINNYIPKAAYYYGIDIFFSIRAAQYGKYIQQVNLGDKIHKPSFPKLENMFIQVASSAIDTLKNMKCRTATGTMKVNKSICISSNKIFTHCSEANKLLLGKVKYLFQHLESFNWLPRSYKDEVRMVLESTKIMDDNLWSNIISNWLYYALKKSKKNSLKIAEELLPFFVLRTVSFWNTTSMLSGVAVEDIIRKQARLIRHKLK